MNYEELVTRIEAVIKENHRQEITGQIMQNVLTDMVGSLGRKFQFWGVASPDSAFTEGDENMVAIAFEAGTYTHFGGVELEENHIGIFMWDGEWHIYTKEIDSYTKEETNTLLVAEAQAREGADNALAEQLGEKQDATDESLTTSSKQVVGAINENKQRIDNLFAIGRYLAIWNAKTGLPTSNPSGTPYPYKAGDWFLVGIIADEGGTNYMPNGTEYTGEASTTPYTEEVPLKVGDRFFFDGTTWKPLVATYPDDNNVKYDEQTLTDAQKLQARTNIGAQEILFKRGFGTNSVVQGGGGSIASGGVSHAEGYNTTASGELSHAEGNKTTASGGVSHAEGNKTTASGELSHAEGSGTFASGYGSHAEGYNTRAQNQGEYAGGNFNKSNKASDSYGNKGNTQHSVGIGTSDTARKNAFEIMQNGDVYVLGLGGYDGTNAGQSGVLSLQAIINAITI